MKLIRAVVMTVVWIIVTFVAWRDLEHLWALLLTILIAEHTVGLWINAEEDAA